MEAKYLSLKTQQQAEMKKVVKQATLEFDEKYNKLALLQKAEKPESEVKDPQSTEEEEEEEEEEENNSIEVDQTRPTTVVFISSCSLFYYFPLYYFIFYFRLISMTRLARDGKRNLK